MFHYNLYCVSQQIIAVKMSTDHLCQTKSNWSETWRLSLAHATW